MITDFTQQNLMQKHYDFLYDLYSECATIPEIVAIVQRDIELEAERRALCELLIEIVQDDACHLSDADLDVIQRVANNRSLQMYSTEESLHWDKLHSFASDELYARAEEHRCDDCDGDLRYGLHQIQRDVDYSARNKPTWHGISLLDTLGIKDDDGTLTAGRVMDMMGNPTVERIPLTYQFGGRRYNSGYHALMRPAMPDDPVDLQIGVVSEEYELITPALVAEIWDKQVGLPVETLAFLKRGATVFITGKLPAFDVAGEPVENYLICNNPMDGKGSASGHVANIRVVCQNTLRAAMNNSSSMFKIEHRKGSARALAKWLGETYQSALMTLDVMNEAYNMLAKKRVERVQIKWIVDELYPLPQTPNPEKPRRVEWEEALENYEYRVQWVERARKTVLRLYDGAGTGADNTATGGTAWGAWNAVAEFETYRRGTSDSLALNVIDGDRGKTIMRAFDSLVKA